MTWVHHVQDFRVSCCDTLLLLLCRVARRCSVDTTTNFQVFDAACMFNYFLWEFDDNFVEVVNPFGNVEEVADVKVGLVPASHDWNCLCFEHRCHGLFSILKNAKSSSFRKSMCYLIGVLERTWTIR